MNDWSPYVGLVDSARKAFGVNALWIKMHQAAAASVGKISTCKVITSLIVNCSLKYKDADRAMLTHLKELGSTARVLSEARVSMLSCKKHRETNRSLMRSESLHHRKFTVMGDTR